ncbi:hypothetical protein GCM10022419_122030 [Nonomuraea rosea]|uniref:Uncharacterized protein n=1 Tax=Nonomuraea rosea TaxID=638574 RepID=A0ABP6ZRZ3_9ACTN
MPVPEEWAPRYLKFLEDYPWLSWSGMCWTVVRSLSGSLDLDDLGARLCTGGSPELVAMSVREGAPPFRPAKVLFVGEGDGSVLLLESNDEYGNKTAVREALSESAEVWSVSWNFNGHDRLSHATGGHTVFDWPDYIYNDVAHGEVPTAVRELLATHTDPLSGGPMPARAAAMSLIEVSTGARMSGDWVDRERQAFVVDHPIPPDEILPPLLAFVDAELNALLRSAAKPVRRRALLHIAREMSDRFGLGHDVVGTSCARLSSGQTLSSEELKGLRALQKAECQAWEAAGGSQRAPMDAAIAIRSALHAAHRGCHDFDALSNVKSALHDEWARFRLALVRMVGDSL